MFLLSEINWKKMLTKFLILFYFLPSISPCLFTSLFFLSLALYVRFVWFNQFGTMIDILVHWMNWNWRRFFGGDELLGQLAVLMLTSVLWTSIGCKLSFKSLTRGETMNIRSKFIINWLWWLLYDIFGYVIMCFEY